MVKEELVRPETADWDEADDAEVQSIRAHLLGAPQAHRLAALFKALSDPTRVRIISALAGCELCVSDLAAALDMSQSAVSHQLGDMRDMHLVRNRREGRHVFYWLDDEHVRDLFDQGLAHIDHQS